MMFDRGSNTVAGRQRSNFYRLVAWLIPWSLLVFSGCGGSDPPATLHDAEHSMPAHWPLDLLDAREKLLERVKRLRDANANLEERATADKQLVEIIGWIPEVAADTDLGEMQWNPIYGFSEALSATRRSASSWRDADLERIEQWAEELGEIGQRLAQIEPADWAEQDHSPESRSHDTEDSP